MKRLFVLAITFILVTTAAVAQSRLTLEGNYQGKNVYVQNPVAGSGVGYCTIKVQVNGKTTTDEINSSAYEIDLSILGLKLGDAVSVVIEHKVDCTPKILNPNCVIPTSTCKYTNVKVNGNKLTWSTTGETGKLNFVVQQYIWNKWINVGEVQGNGTNGTNNYEFMLTPHSGENKVRVVQVDHTAKPNPSQPVTFTDPSVKPVECNPKKVRDVLNFTAKTRYEIYDSYGNLVKKGYDDKVDCSNLKKGVYYINFDNKDDQIVKS